MQQNFTNFTLTLKNNMDLKNRLMKLFSENVEISIRMNLQKIHSIMTRG